MLAHVITDIDSFAHIASFTEAAEQVQQPPEVGMRLPFGHRHRLHEVPAVNHDGVANMLVHLARTSDRDTGKHLGRVQEYVAALASVIQFEPRYAGEVSDDWLQTLLTVAPLHDIGKIGIPGTILLKPSSLTADEAAVMRKHCWIGHDIISEAEKQFSLRPEYTWFWDLAKEVALFHHERWNGSGYPFRLAGEAIPLSARLVALADIFDALTSARVYRPAMPLDEVIEYIPTLAGSDLDPGIVDAFVAAESEFRHIAAKGIGTNSAAEC